jgi:hypothetical protein
MSESQRQIIRQLYELDPWADYVPGGPASDHVEGWNGNHPSFGRLVGATDAKVVIDLGVWKGQSSITLARAMKDAGIEGCVVAIDTFLGSAEHWRSDLSTFTRRHGMPDLDEWPGVVRAADEFSARQGRRPLTLEWPKWILQKPC